MVARMDCNYAYEAALKAHPEWFERNAGRLAAPARRIAMAVQDLHVQLYFSEQMPAIYREINRRYRVDGFFTNGWPGTGALAVCYCDSLP